MKDFVIKNFGHLKNFFKSSVVNCSVLSALRLQIRDPEDRDDQGGRHSRHRRHHHHQRVRARPRVSGPVALEEVESLHRTF